MNDPQLLELRDVSFFAVADALDELQSAIETAEAGQYPSRKVDVLGQEITILTLLFSLTDDGQTSPEDIDILFGTTQHLFRLAESCFLLIPSVNDSNQRLFAASQLNFLECISYWTLFLIKTYSHHEIKHDLDCTALLAIKEGLLSHQIPSSMFVFLGRCLQLLTSILRNSDHNDRDHNDRGADLIEQIEPSVIEAAFIHLTELDSFITQSPQLFDLTYQTIINDFFCAVGETVLKMTHTDIYRVNPSFESKAPIVEMTSTLFVFLLTYCAVKWNSYILVVSFNALSSIKTLETIAAY